MDKQKIAKADPKPQDGIGGNLLSLLNSKQEAPKNLEGEKTASELAPPSALKSEKKEDT